jgi:hypothetical protein
MATKHSYSSIYIVKPECTVLPCTQEALRAKGFTFMMRLVYHEAPVRTESTDLTLFSERKTSILLFDNITLSKFWAFVNGSSSEANAHHFFTLLTVNTPATKEKPASENHYLGPPILTFTSFSTWLCLKTFVNKHLADLDVGTTVKTPLDVSKGPDASTTPDTTRAPSPAPAVPIVSEDFI